MTVAETSRAAYEEFTLADLADKQREVLEALGKSGPMNNRQLAKFMGWEVNRVTPRILELRELGLVGEVDRRPDPETGHMAMVWGQI